MVALPNNMAHAAEQHGSPNAARRTDLAALQHHFWLLFCAFIPLLHRGKRLDETCAYDSAINKLAIAGHGGVWMTCIRKQASHVLQDSMMRCAIPAVLAQVAQT